MDKRALLRPLGYGAFALFSLLVGLYVTFPGPAVARRLNQEVQQRSGGAVSLSLKDVSLYWLTGIEAEDVRMKLHLSEPPVPVTIDDLSIRLQLLPLLWLQPTVGVDLTIGEAEVSARVARGGESLGIIDVEIENLNVAKPPLVAGLTQVPVGGVLNLRAEIDLQADPKASTGEATVSIGGLSVGPGETLKGFALPNPIGAGQLDLSLKIEGGQVSLTKFEQHPSGKPVDLELKRVTLGGMLKPMLRASTYDACLEFKLSDAFLAANPKFQAAMDIASQVQFRKDNDGYLHTSFGGNISGAPRLRRKLCTEGGASERTESRGGRSGVRKGKRARPGLPNAEERPVPSLGDEPPPPIEEIEGQREEPPEE